MALSSRRTLRDLAVGAERFTQARVERILAVVVALGCAVLGTQGFLNALGSTQELPHWHTALQIIAFVPLALMIVSLSVGVLPRLASALCACSLVVVLACWPFATAGVASDPGREPWIWYLLNVATAAAAVAFRLTLQIAFAVLVPVLYAVVRLEQIGLARSAVTAVALDAVFALILAGVIVALGWILRAVARGLDTARADAVASYAAAAEADAVEAERVAVAALMHDSVLAALIAGARATTPREESLAVGMAREALTRLANAEQDAGEGSDDPVSPGALVGALDRALDSAGAAVSTAARIAPDATAVPGRVARALVLAAMQAVANARQHSAGRGLRLALAADDAGVRVRVVDTGAGFDPAAVPADRLGIRGSIVARMAAVGGGAVVQTGPAGTTVELRWEVPR